MFERATGRSYTATKVIPIASSRDGTGLTCSDADLTQGEAPDGQFDDYVSGICVLACNKVLNTDDMPTVSHALPVAVPDVMDLPLLDHKNGAGLN
jgi:hypothetical protein